MAKQRTINIVYKVNKKEIDAASASTKKIKGETEKFKKEVKETETAGTKAFKAIGAAILAVGIGSLVKDILRLGAAQQQLNIAFTTFLGDANKAKKLIAELTKFSIVTPFTPEQVNKAAKSLLAFGVEAGKIIPTLKFLGDVSAGTGKDLAEMAIIFGQIRSTGRLMGQDLLQLINAGFNPLQIISEKTGKSVAALKKEMEKGLVTFEDVEDAFITATSAGGLFFNLMEKQSASIAGKWSTIMGNIEEVAKGIFEANIDIIDTLVTKLSQYTAAFNELLAIANSDPIFARAQKNLDSYTTSQDEAGKATDLLAQAINNIAESGDADLANKLFKDLTDGINEYEESVSFLVRQLQGASGDEFDRLNLILQSEQQTIKLLFGAREQLKKDAVTASVKFDLQQAEKEAELARSATEEQLTIGLDYYKTRDDLQKKWEKFFQDQIEESNKVQEGLIKDQYDFEFNELERKNQREVKEIDEHNKELERLEKEKQDRLEDLKKQAFNAGLDVLSQALHASISTDNNLLESSRDYYNNQIELAGDNQRRKDEIRLKQEQAEAGLRKRIEEEDKRSAIKRIGIDTAINIIRSIVNNGGIPLGLPFGALAAAAGLAQVAVVKGFKDGVIDLQGEGTTTSDSIPARLSKGESVMTAEETRKNIGILKDIRAKKLDDKIFEKLTMNGGSVVASLDDRRIVSAIEKSRVNLSREGATLYEHQRVSENFTRKVRAKIIRR